MKPLRKCRVCGLEIYDKSKLNIFKKHKNNKYGRDQICKTCHGKQRKELYDKTPKKPRTELDRQRDKEYYVKNRDKKREYHREYYKNNKDKWREPNRAKMWYKDKMISLKENPRKGICEHCGKTELEHGRQLDLHHIEYDDNNPTANIIELCHECHMKLHYPK